MNETVKIIALAVVASIAYGVVHDQITARICVEYFTIGHPRILDTEDPTMLGLVWGGAATWWVGLILGIMLAAAARAGRWSRVGVAQLGRPFVLLLLIVGALAAIAGIVGYYAAVLGSIQLLGELAERIPSEKHVAFLIVLSAHIASYGGGALGGVVLCVWVIRSRRRKAISREE